MADTEKKRRDLKLWQVFAILLASYTVCLAAGAALMLLLEG